MAPMDVNTCRSSERSSLRLGRSSGRAGDGIGSSPRRLGGTARARPTDWMWTVVHSAAGRITAQVRQSRQAPRPRGLGPARPGAGSLTRRRQAIQYATRSRWRTAAVTSPASRGPRRVTAIPRSLPTATWRAPRAARGARASTTSVHRSLHRAGGKPPGAGAVRPVPLRREARPTAARSTPQFTTTSRVCPIPSVEHIDDDPRSQAVGLGVHSSRFHSIPVAESRAPSQWPPVTKPPMPVAVSTVQILHGLGDPS